MCLTFFNWCQQANARFQDKESWKRDLAIYHSSRVSIGKVEARMIAHSVFLSYCIALVNLLGRSLDE